MACVTKSLQKALKRASERPVKGLPKALLKDLQKAFKSFQKAFKRLRKALKKPLKDLQKPFDDLYNRPHLKDDLIEALSS